MPATATGIATVTPSKIGPSLIMIHPPPLETRAEVSGSPVWNRRYSRCVLLLWWFLPGLKEEGAEVRSEPNHFKIKMVYGYRVLVALYFQCLLVGILL